MSQTAVVDNYGSKREMVCTENATRERDEKPSSQILAFSIDKIMSDDMRPGASRSSERCRVWKTGERTTRLVHDDDDDDDDDAMTPEPEVVANRRHSNKPEVNSRHDAMRYHQLQQQKLKLADAMMLHMATENGISPEVGGLFPAVRGSHPSELLFRHYQMQQPYHHLRAAAERYRQNPAGIASLPTFSRRQLPVPVSSEVTWSLKTGSAEYRHMSESLHSPTRPTIWRKRSPHDDVTKWSQMAANCRVSPAASPQSVISGCSALHDDDEEIVVDDDTQDRKQFSPTSELPVEGTEIVNDRSNSSWTEKHGDMDLERSPGERLKSTTWSVANTLYMLLLLPWP